MSGVQENHGCIRYRWRILANDGATTFDGVDIAQLDASGRFHQLIELDDPVPSLA